MQPSGMLRGNNDGVTVKNLVEDKLTGDGVAMTIVPLEEGNPPGAMVDGAKKLAGEAPAGMMLSCFVG
jgi:hypothetical protein